jgi:MFS family permease
MSKRNQILLVLCLGYFIDFYDLTVISVSYVDLFKEQFGYVNSTVIQQMYYLTNNIQMGGILVGAIIFGILADKYGRMTVIKYSILLYSVATILSIFTSNIYIFMGLRFIAYLGLASEFAVSTVLIIEFFPRKTAAWGMSLLYMLGVLGGVTATLFGVFSYKFMFVFGGVFGLMIYFFRSKLEESPHFISMYDSKGMKNAGSILYLIKNYSKPLFANLIITMPFFFVITIMFALVRFISPEADFSSLVKLFLFGFFAGNIISCVLSGFYNQYFSKPNLYFVINIIIFVLCILMYSYVTPSNIFIYGSIIGLVGGGYNIMWAQHAATEFPTEIRALACNMIFALGRTSCIFFGIIFSYLILDESIFKKYIFIMTICIAMIVLLVLAFYKRKKFI